MNGYDYLPRPSAGFDEGVRSTLRNLPERRAKRRFTAGRVAAIALAAALCLGGGALAVNGGLFPLLFPDGGEAVGDYVQTPAGAADENEDWRLSVEGVLFDESTGAGLISLKLEDKTGEGGTPFTLGETFKEYRRPGIAWSRLTECFAAPDAGQYGFIINTANQGGVGGHRAFGGRRLVCRGRVHRGRGLRGRGAARRHDRARGRDARALRRPAGV